MRQDRFPPGWDEERVRKVLAHYEEQTADEAVAEDEAAFEESTQTVMEVPPRTGAGHSGADCEAPRIKAPEGQRPSPNPYEDSLCQETNYSLERFFVIFSAFQVLA